jgi:hypothetical protein
LSFSYIHQQNMDFNIDLIWIYFFSYFSNHLYFDKHWIQVQDFFLNISKINQQMFFDVDV